MILIDANILIYAHSASFPQHGAARDWLDARLTDRERVALPWPSLLPHVSRPELVQDAHLAALPIGHGLTLCSTDGDFARFPGLRWENPLR